MYGPGWCRRTRRRARRRHARSRPASRSPTMTTQPAASPIPPRSGAKQRRTIAGGAIGTLMEYFDYYLYGLAAAAVFPQVFFSGDSPLVAQLSSFASFAVGFLFRPLGGIVFGAIVDRLGRNVTLLVNVIGMGVSTVSFCLISTYVSL